jgi:archaellum biogenesis protein FlaJ (TadC family)
MPKIKRRPLRSFWQRNKKTILYSLETVVFLIISPKQTIVNMISWLRERLSEPSTYRSVVGFTSVLGLSVNPEMIEQITVLAVSILSFIEFVRKERKDN